jgi:hypothetical protein
MLHGNEGKSKRKCLAAKGEVIADRLQAVEGKNAGRMPALPGVGKGEKSTDRSVCAMGSSVDSGRWAT